MTMTKFYGKGEELVTKDYIDKEIKAQISTMLNNVIALQYSKESSYNIGDFVIYNNILYVCNTAIPTGEKWTENHWTQIRISDELI